MKITFIDGTIKTFDANVLEPAEYEDKEGETNGYEGQIYELIKRKYDSDGEFDADADSPLRILINFDNVLYIEY